jgi:hypothetical protein
MAKRLNSKEKLDEYIRRKNEDKREKEHLKNSRDYQPEHPDNQ